MRAPRRRQAMRASRGPATPRSGLPGERAQPSPHIEGGVNATGAARRKRLPRSPQTGTARDDIAQDPRELWFSGASWDLAGAATYLGRGRGTSGRARLLRFCVASRSRIVWSLETTVVSRAVRPHGTLAGLPAAAPALVVGINQTPTPNRPEREQDYARGCPERHETQNTHQSNHLCFAHLSGSR